MRRRLALSLPLLTACQPTAPSVVPEADGDRGGALRMAVTVDDLPSHGPLPAGGSRSALHEQMLAAFERHGIEAYGFINGARAHDGDDERASLEAWVAAGQPLANHTHAHPRMQEIGVPAYLQEIDANEALLATLVPDPDTWHVFRYPYLFEGTDPAATVAVREHLARRGYRIAQVTVDFYDWSFNAPYVRCLATGEDAAITALRERYIEHARDMLHWSVDAADALWHRDVAHVLLLHVGAFGAEMLEPLLGAYEAEGVTWIPLAEAMDDPIYATPPTLAGATQGTYVDQMLASRAATDAGRPNGAPPAIVQPLAGLDALCPIGR